MRVRTLVVMLMTAIVIVACAPSGDGQGDPVQLDGTNWVLLTLDGQPALPGTVIIAAFSEGQIAGHSGCNSYFGAYTLDGSRIGFDAIGMTEMACLEPEGAMTQETAYLEILQAVTEVQLTDGQLTMWTASDEVLVFAPAASTP